MMIAICMKSTISFNMQCILYSNYYNIGKYLVQTRSQAKSSGTGLPEVHVVGKGLVLKVLPGKKTSYKTHNNS